MSESARYQIIFRKGDEARFLSHLDLMATLTFAVRRAGLPVELSQGFNPRPKLSLAASLAVGYTGEQEILEVTLREWQAEDQIREQLQAALPPGIAILKVTPVSMIGKPAGARTRAARYRITLPVPVADLALRVATLLDRERIEVEDEQNGKVRRRDLRPMILSASATNEKELDLTVALENTGSVRPESVLAAMGIPTVNARISRVAVLLDE